MKKDITFYDKGYFGHEPVVQHKSNYSRVGGYNESMSASDLFVDWIFTLNPNVLKVLEIGCSCGVTIKEFRKRNVEAYGIDCSEYILSTATSDVAPFIFFEDMHNLSHTITSLAPFDIICSKDVLEHTDENNIDNVLLQFASLCTTQAHVINTGEFEYQAADGDSSHTLIRPLIWWEDKFSSLNLSYHIRRT
jgi:2-polyprenyl-3-methyl-5-hydroxy-6-metoxy-1,4-benzoquinol methylase